MLEPARAYPEELARRGYYVEFGSDEVAVSAARALAERGLELFDAYGPRPVAALEELVAPDRSTLNRTVFVAGCVGALSGLAVQWACNAWDYPLNVGGRPPFSLPAFIPITFEATVLFAAFAAFFGFMHRARLPWLSHPAFAVPGFERASVDRFFLFIGPSAELSEAALRALLLELGALRVTAHPVPNTAPARDVRAGAESAAEETPSA